MTIDFDTVVLAKFGLPLSRHDGLLPFGTERAHHGKLFIMKSPSHFPEVHGDPIDHVKLDQAKHL